MRRAWAAAALVVVAGCRPTPPAADVVAETRSGTIRLGDVERALAPSAKEAAALPASPGDPDLARYRKAAESIAVERALLTDVDESDAAIAGLGKEYLRIRRQAVLQLWERESQAARPISVSPAEVKEYFEAHPDEFHRKPLRFVWHMFRRHQDPRKPEATVAFLAGLKERLRKGESFRDLAREYSQSETRLLGGRLGFIGREKLPKPLSDIVFALPLESVSDPILVPGGAVLFYVSEAYEEKRFPLEDVQLLITQKLWDQKRRERVADATRDWKLPEGSIVLDDETLERTLEGPDPEELVLKVGASEWSAKEFRDALAELPEERVQILPTWGEKESPRDFYERLKREAVLYEKLQAEGFAEAPLRQRAVQERVRALGRQALSRQRIEERIWKRVDGDEAALRQFHQENRFLYQTPLRLKIKSLSVPLGPDAPRTMLQMEALREELARGATNLEAAAKRVGGTVREGDWLDPAGLDALEPKVRYYVMDMNGTGYTVPFQLNRRLSIMYVEKRDEPRQLPYEQVRDRVRKDYHDRHQQELYQAVVQDVLKDANFRFHEEAVRRSLGAAAPQA